MHFARISLGFACERSRGWHNASKPSAVLARPATLWPDPSTRKSLTIADSNHLHGLMLDWAQAPGANALSDDELQAVFEAVAAARTWPLRRKCRRGTDVVGVWLLQPGRWQRLCGPPRRGCENVRSHNGKEPQASALVVPAECFGGEGRLALGQVANPLWGVDYRPAVGPHRARKALSASDECGRGDPNDPEERHRSKSARRGCPDG